MAKAVNIKMREKPRVDRGVKLTAERQELKLRDHDCWRVEYNGDAYEDDADPALPAPYSVGP